MIDRIHLLLASATISLVAVPAAAQQAPAAAASDTPAPQASGDNGAIKDIVVTAERREQTLQHAPAAVTAVSGDTLVSRGITDMKGLALLVPSTRFSVETNVVQVYIRGIGSQIDSPFVPEPVATNFNEVYLPRFITGTSLYDVSQVEVLPGPQGTLYGRSALGGVVNINAAMPKQSFGVDANLEVGNYDTTRLTAALNVPLASDLAVRAAFNMNNHGPYYTSGIDTEHSKAGRLSLLYNPGDLSIYLWGSYYENHNKPQATAYIPFLDPKNPWNQPLTDPAGAAFYPPDGYDVQGLYGDYYSTMAGGRLEWKLGGATLTYIPSYIDAHFNDVRGLQGLPVTDTARIHQTTHELRLAGDPNATFSWLTGLYYYRNDTFWHAYLGPFLGGYKVPNVAEGEAAFAQLGYRITDAIRATVGGRYSWDREDADNAADVFPASLAPPTEGLIPFTAHPRWQHFDWKVGLQADVGPQSIVYANVQSGYAPGGYQAVQPVAGQRLEQQTMVGYTLGTKNRFFDGKLQANAEFFLYNYKNYDITVQSGAASISFGVPKTTIYGAQIDLIYAVTNHTQFNANIGLLSAEIKQLVSNGVDYSGYQLPYAPKATISAGFQQGFDLGGGATLLFRVDTHYESGYWGVFSHTSGLHQGAFTKTDLTLTFTPPSGNWDLSLWARNLENSATFAAAAETGYPAPFQGAAFLESPRTFGARLHVKFGRP